MKTNKLFKSIMTASLSGVLALGTIVPVYATVDNTEDFTSPIENEECEVVYVLGSTAGGEDGAIGYTVTIPKKITLGTDKTSDYTVTVKGDISSDKKVTVIPDNSFLMSDQSGVANAKPDVEATVTQAVTDWTWDELAANDGEGTAKTGNVSATGLTAGSWAGTFNFDIALEDLQ